MYKIQVQRPLSPHERRLLNNPTERFLAAFLPEFERRLNPAPASPRAPTPGPRR